MLRKLGVITVALLAAGGVAMPALGSTALPRTATVNDTLFGVGVYFVHTGQAAETLAGGPTTTIAASCQVTMIAVFQMYDVTSPQCYILDVTTGQKHHLATVTTGHTGTAASVLTLTTSHRFKLCVGGRHEHGSTLITEAPCRELVRGG